MERKMFCNQADEVLLSVVTWRALQNNECYLTSPLPRVCVCICKKASAHTHINTHITQTHQSVINRKIVFFCPKYFMVACCLYVEVNIQANFLHQGNVFRRCVCVCVCVYVMFIGRKVRDKLGSCMKGRKIRWDKQITDTKRTHTHFINILIVDGSFKSFYSIFSLYLMSLSVLTNTVTFKYDSKGWK